MKLLVRLMLLLGLFSAQSSFAFPEMIRKGYANCNTCHVSPSGGGALTDYGRQIFKEVLSTWSGEKENEVFYGAAQPPEWLVLGGDVRGLQTYQDTPAYRAGKWFLMQADVEAAVVTQHITVDATIDRDIGNPDDKGDDKTTSLKHYILVPLSDEVSLRAGKFIKNYGLGIPDHTSQIRRGIGFDEGSETYNLEANIITEHYSLVGTWVDGRDDDHTVISEKGLAISAMYFLEPSYKFGYSFYRGRTTDYIDRTVTGPNWSIGVSKAYWLGELDVLAQNPDQGKATTGWVTYNKVGYEIFHGCDVYLVHESKKNDRDKKDYDFIGYGPGFQWSPRPHFIFTGQWEKQVSPSSIQPRTTDFAYFVGQYAI